MKSLVKIFFTALITFVSNLNSDSLQLKNGKRIQATILEQSGNYIIYKDKNGTVQTIPKSEVESIYIGYITVEKAAMDKEQESSPVSIEFTHEIVSDFIWRGQSYGGEYLARRNNMPYKEVTQYWAYQPTIQFRHESGAFIELWGNVALSGRPDRDSDMRLFQASPGGNAIDPNRLADRLANGNFTADAEGLSAFFDPDNNVVNSVCTDPAAAQAKVIADAGAINNCFVDFRKIKRYKERNGMYRTDGLFTSFAYEMNAGSYGTFTFGTWWYFQNDKNNNYSWQEYYIWWSLPILKGITDPSIQFYTQNSYDFGGQGAGNHYLSLYNSHTFMEGSNFQIQPYNNIGYQSSNNNISQRSGIMDITTGIKFIIFSNFFFSINHAHRPNIYMYDNDVFYFTNSQNSPILTNKENDGKTSNPSKLYGAVNQFVYEQIDALPDTSELAKLYIKEKYQLQDIPRNLYWLSFGFTHKL